MSRWAVARLGCCAVVALLQAGCSGTSDGGEGDKPALPAVNPYGTGSRIHELIGPATWENLDDRESLHCVMPQDRYVSVSGASVTAIDRYDETHDGGVGNIYVQDTLATPVQYSGVTVYNPSFTPPDMRLVEGDVVDLYGTLSEFYSLSSGPFSFCHSLPEIGGTMAFRFDDGGVAPVVLESANELAGYANMRRYLGMLVTIPNVELRRIPAEEDPSGRYAIDMEVGNEVWAEDVPSISNEMFDLYTETRDMQEGQVLQSVTGIVTWFFDTSISPRRASDIVR